VRVLVEAVAEAAAHARLGRQVEHGRPVDQQPPERRGDHVGGDEVEPRLRREAGEVRVLVGRVVVGRERVDTGDVPAVGDEPLGQP
jgi:hypothetical protein